MDRGQKKARLEEMLQNVLEVQRCLSDMRVGLDFEDGEILSNEDEKDQVLDSLGKALSATTDAAGLLGREVDRVRKEIRES
jgi:hypothetical protein